MAKKGGYQIVVLETLTYAFALECLNCDKPLLIYDGKNKPYFADSIVLNDDDEVVIQKGGQTITIEEDDTITIDGDIPVSGGGGGGLQLYKHTFTDTNSGEKYVIITDNSTPIEYDGIFSYHLVGNVLGISLYLDYSGNDEFWWVDGASLATNAGSEAPSNEYTPFTGVIYFKGTTVTRLTFDTDLEDVVTPL